MEMMNNFFNQTDGSYSKQITTDFFRNVYAYMFAALAISGIIAYATGTPEFFAKYFLNETQTGLKPLFWIIAFAPLGLGLLIQTMYTRLSLGVLMLLFGLYAVLMGLSLSSVLLVYSGAQIALTFFVTAGAFAAMAILGFTTKTDLTKMGSLLYMLFIGIFIAGIANIFIESSMLGFGIAVAGVFVFTGLTAYYMQQLKTLSQDPSLSSMDRNKLAIVGGLMLYILFVNLFLSLLRLLGGRE